MAFASLGGKRGILSDVNVVPLIDILLVLLVIFMIIPHHQMGLQADLPQQSASPDSVAGSEAIIVQLSSDGSLRINPSVIEREALPVCLQQAFALRAQHSFCRVIARSSFTRWHRFSISCTPPAPPRSAC